MRSDRRGLTVLSLVIILIIVGLVLLVLFRLRAAPEPDSTSAPVMPAVAPATGNTSGVLTVVREPELTLQVGALDTISVRLANSTGVPIANVSIVFDVESGGGTVDPPTVSTDATGLARTVWRVGGEPGVNVLRATADAPGMQVPPLVLTVTTPNP